jgi:cyclin-dependent kinase 12/13
MDQLKLIFDLIGTPTPKTWEGFNELKLIRTKEVTIDKLKRPKLREKYGSKIQPMAGKKDVMVSFVHPFVQVVI